MQNSAETPNMGGKDRLLNENIFKKIKAEGDCVDHDRYEK